ncbi:MAG TPA: hypothetical protein VH210_07020 [Gaiellaceae bacterium]|nr:hypothetical protein [Gaiellaceae bacterium]
MKISTLPFNVYNDLAVTDPSILNPSSDIGKTQYLVGDHDGYAVFSRTWVANGGRTLAFATRTTFWAGIGPAMDAAGLCATSPQGEPSVAYDWQADSWVVSEAAYAVDSNNNPTGPFVECVAVSTGPDATGTWNRYVFQVSTTLYPDHPTIGVWSDGYYLSFNQHTSDGTWAGAGALAMERTKMLQGLSAQSRYFDLENVTPGLGGLLPANINGYNQPAANAPELYLQAHDDTVNNTHDRLEIWGFHVDWTAPVTGSTFQPLVNIPLNTQGAGYRSTFSCADPGNPNGYWTACLAGRPTVLGDPAFPLEPLSVVYSDTADALPQLGGRLEWGRSPGGNETLAATATQDMAGGYATPAWFKLTNIGGAGWGIGARGFFDPADSTSRYLPSSAFDNSGNVALGYVKTSASTFLTTAFTNASANSTETNIDAGTVPWTTNHTYGGGTSLSLDPIDLCTFWFTGPLPDGGGHVNSIDNFSFNSCAASTTQPPLLTADPTLFAPLVREGLTITGTAAGFSGGTSTTYQWRRCDTHGLNCVDIPGEVATTHLMTAADAVGDRTLRFQQKETNGNGTSIAISADTTIVQSIPPANTVRPVITGTPQAGRALATTTGTWTSSSPLSYTYRWRRCTSGVCVNISGANAASYTLTSADVGSTIDAVVSATNTGGGTDANALATASIVAATVVAPPVSGGGGGGGGTGGGGTGGALDLSVTGYQTPSNPQLGDTVTYVLAVNDLTSNQLAQNVNLTVTLPAGVSLVSTSADRGSGCTATSATQVKCFLDFLSGQAPRANVLISAKVNTAGSQVLTATVTAQQSESSLTNNTLTLTYTAGATTTTTTPATKTSGGVPVGLNGDGTPTKKQDKKKPTSKALSSSGKRGHSAQLRFKVYDEHGVAKVVTKVKWNSTVVGTPSTGFGPVAYGSTYFLPWYVPTKAAKGHYSFCVVAYDRAGNKSAQSCAPLALK